MVCKVRATHFLYDMLAVFQKKGNKVYRLIPLLFNSFEYLFAFSVCSLKFVAKL